MYRLVPLVVFLAWVPASVMAADGNQAWLENWPQWRGPGANGVAPHADPPIHWDDHTNILWKVALPGRGSATPIVWGEQIFIATAIDTGKPAAPADVPKPDPKFETKTKAPSTYHQFVVMSIDRESGKIQWQRIAAEAVPHEGRHPTHSYAAGSPTTDGNRLYVSFGSRGIFCYDLAGELQWKRSLGVMHTRFGWGEGASPTLHGDTLIVNWDHEGGSFVAALDAKTGAIRWKTDRDEPTSWATPLVLERRGRAQVIVNGTKRIRSYDLATGKEIWECGGMTINAIPSPVAQDGELYCMTGYRGSAAFAIPLDVTGDVTDSGKIRWRLSKGTPYVPSPLLAGGRLYFTQSNDALLTCVDVKTGKPILDRVRLSGLTSFYASPIAAKDRVYLVGRDGTTLVIKQSDKLEILATNRLDDPIDASPVAVGMQLFLRGEKYLYCVEEK